MRGFWWKKPRVPRVRTGSHRHTPETHKGLKRVTLICLLCPMLVIIHFPKYHIWNEKQKITDQSKFVNDVKQFSLTFPRPLKKWLTNGGKTSESRVSFQRLKSGSLPKYWAGKWLTTRDKRSIREFKIRRLRTTNYGWTSVVLCS